MNNIECTKEGLSAHQLEFKTGTERERIGKRIREIRTEEGLSAYQLEFKTGLKRQNIERIELGKYSTGIDILGKIADALGYEIDFVKKKSTEN